jgi:hypothetical protein
MKDITIVLWATANNGDNYIKKEVRLSPSDLELLKFLAKFPTDRQKELWGMTEQIKALLAKLESVNHA